MLNITGEQVIFKNKNNAGYYTTTSNKLEDGTFEKNFITVGFRKGVELDNFTKINIKDGFLTHYSYQNEDGETIKRFKIMVKETPAGIPAGVFNQNGEFPVSLQRLFKRLQIDYNSFMIFGKGGLPWRT